MKLSFLLATSPLCLLAAACLPTRHASVSLPVRCLDGEAHAEALLEIPIAQLERQLPGLVLDQVAFYADGRQPIPFRLLPEEGRPEVVQMVVRVQAEDRTRVLVVYPGPRAAGTFAADPALPRAEARFEQARR